MKKSVPKVIAEDSLQSKFRNKLKLENGQDKKEKGRGKRTVIKMHSL